MRDRRANERDLQKVMRDLAQRCRDEIETADFSVPKARKIVNSLIRRGNAKALIYDDQVLAIIAWDTAHQADEPYAGTYFLANERFFSADVPSARFGRKLMRRIQSELGNLPIVSMCYGTHLSIERWYRIIGYRLSEVNGHQKVFVLDPTP